MDQPASKRDRQRGEPSSYEIVYPTTFDSYHIATQRTDRLDATRSSPPRANHSAKPWASRTFNVKFGVRTLELQGLLETLIKRMRMRRFVLR